MTIRQNVTWVVVVVFPTTSGISVATAAERPSLKEKFPEGVEVIPVIEALLLLENLL